MALHGTPVELLNMDFSTYLYPSGDVDTAMDGYDAAIATLNSEVAALTPVARSFSSGVSRSLNTAFQVSTTRDAVVSYSVDVSVASLLLAGAQGTVTLQYADNSGFTTNVKTVTGGTNATGGVLNVSNVGTVNFMGMIPANKYVKLVTANTTGTPTFSYRTGQEVLL